MKVALITDTHWGVRGDHQAFYTLMDHFYLDFFFPFLEKRGIKRIIHLGDIVDRRKFISYLTLRKLKSQFVLPVIERGLEADVIIGNHDTFFKNTNEVNSMNELFSSAEFTNNFRWHDEPTEIDLDGTSVLLMPWICSGNYERCMQAIKDTKATILMGHLEVSGFEMYRGAVSDHGFASDVFKKFDLVFSGHFHHKSTRGNINYLGAPYEMTWSDYNDERGFHIFDTETRQLEFIENPYRMFHKIIYNDAGKTMEELLSEVDYERLKDTFVKIVIKNKTNPYWFDLLVEKVEKSSPVDVQIVEDHLNLDLLEEDDLVDEAEDTLTIMRKFASNFVQEGDDDMKKELDKVLSSLYQQALNMESSS